RDLRRAMRRRHCARHRAEQAHRIDSETRLAGRGGEPSVPVYRTTPTGQDLRTATSTPSMILKLKRTPGIYLVGFMGSGKTTIGRLLAEELGWGFADLDEEIEKREGMSISQIFETRGEAGFRQAET